MSIAQGDEETSRVALENLIELVEFSPSFFLNQLEELLENMFKVATDNNLEDDILFLFFIFIHFFIFFKDFFFPLIPNFTN